MPRARGAQEFQSSPVHSHTDLGRSRGSPRDSPIRELREGAVGFSGACPSEGVPGRGVAGCFLLHFIITPRKEDLQNCAEIGKSGLGKARKEVEPPPVSHPELRLGRGSTVQT